ncbi:MAG: ABC transporter permease [Ilumatobacteraceae bacterium]|nr:MAG: ABC transporter permease [Actinomycetota bacterium]
MTPFLAQLRAELRLVARNPEQLLLTLGIPVLLLVFFSLVAVLPTGSGPAVDFLAPGIVALAVMSTAMVSLGIGTGFERGYAVLKRLGATPLGRGRWLAAKIGAIVVVELVQLAVLVPVAFALGWDPSAPRWLLAIASVVAGTTAFAGLGLLLAGRLRAEVNLAVQNALFVVLLLLGGMVIPFDELPGPIAAVARVLPSGALADLLREALAAAGDKPSLSAAVLAAWSVATPLAAARWFRWS